SAVQNRGINVGITQNRMLVMTVSISFITQLCLIYVPIMQSVFQTAALNAKDLGTSFGLHEMRRGWERRRMAEGGMASANGRAGRRGSRWFGGEEEEESWAGRVQERV
ncbi:hypothetical protein MPER_01187, partial [Moniliophthora perniciosa FA553]